MKYLLLLLLFAGCSYHEAQRDLLIKKINGTSSNDFKMIYVKDERTGLCFAVLGNELGGRTSGLACVPCEQIEDFLENRNE